jgi:acyl-CoA synthetase (AMP-forming)/AMP-acid ligase II
MGIIRAGYVAFPISPRNSAIGIANLLVKTKCTFLFVSEDAPMESLAEEALGMLGSDPELIQHSKVHQLALPTFDGLFPEKDDGFKPLPPFRTPSVDTPVFILHSSGALLRFLHILALISLP